MNKYLLDTKIISDMICNPDGSVARQIEKIGSQGICTSIIVASELRYGCAKKGSIKLLTRVEELLKLIPVLPLDISAGDEYGGIRFELEAAGQPIGMNDLWIAAHAYALKFTLVTDNTREFKRIRGLKVENWLKK